VIEGARWQFYPAYLLALGLVARRLVRRQPPKQRRTFLNVPTVGGLAIVAGTAVVGWALPVPVLPDPTGAMAVGTVSWEVTDPDRIEPYDTSGEPRRVVAQAWYPADLPNAPVADPDPWVTQPDPFGPAAASNAGLPSFAMDHLELVESNAVESAPIADGPWPVVVYSHGWTGVRNIQSNYAEELASHGFVVLSLDHTYAAVVTLFPDGDSVRLNEAALPFPSDVGPFAYQTAIELLGATFAEDVRTVLDQLEAGEGPELLTGTLVLDSVGLSGHSTGGGAMIRLCQTDDRCAAVLGFDPWVVPVPDSILEPGSDTPLLSIRSQAWQSHPNDERLRPFHELSAGDQGLYVIEGTTHSDFTLQSFVSPLTGVINLTGKVDGEPLHAAVNATALGFFDQHLRGGPPINVPALIQPD